MSVTIEIKTGQKHAEEYIEEYSEESKESIVLTMRGTFFLPVVVRLPYLGFTRTAGTRDSIHTFIDL